MSHTFALPRPRPLFAACLLAFPLLFPAGAQAASEDEALLAMVYGDKQSISIATGSHQSLRRAPAVASVITAEEIAAMGAIDLDHVLEAVPGIHVARNPITNAPIYAIRGIYSQNNPQVLMLQNGVPVTTSFVGSKGNVWAGLPLENVARIEIIRGPGSALYGADAYAGVINIITKSSYEQPGTQIGARVGSFRSRDGWLLYGGQWGEVEVAAYVRSGTTHGYRESVTADAQTFNDQIFGSSASLAPGQANNGSDSVDGNLELSYQRWHLRSNYKLRDHVQTGVGVAAALDPVGQARSERLLFDLGWQDQQLSADWGAGFNASYMSYQDTVPSPFVLFPAGTRFPTGVFTDGMIGAPEKWERQLRLSGFALYNGWQQHRLRLGLGYDDLDIYRTAERKNFSFTASGIPVPLSSVRDYSNSAPFMRPQRRTVAYAYAQDEYQLAADWALTAGVRHDRYSDFGGTTNPRLALVWDVSSDLTAKLLAGRAFRAPAFVEEYSINNPVQRGNPDLRPETITSQEAVLNWQARNNLQVNLNVFQYRMKDVIRLLANPIAGTGSSYFNTGSQTGRGMELEAAWTASRSLRLSGNYARQHAIDDASNSDAGYVPRHHYYGRADWQATASWLGSLQINRVAGRQRAFGDSRSPLADYTTVDLTVRTTSSDHHWDFSATVRNLFDVDAREPSMAPGLTLPNDLPQPGRNFYLQATYRL